MMDFSLSWESVAWGVLFIVVGIPLLVFAVMFVLHRAGIIQPPSRSTDSEPFSMPTQPDASQIKHNFWKQAIIFGLLTLILILGLRGLSQASNPPRGMVLIPGGPFTMGSSEEQIFWAAETFFSESLDYYRDETPAHRVELSPFYIDKTEVRVGDFKDYLAETGQSPPRYFDNEKFNRHEQPVVGVTWQEASSFCKWAGKRLPTEAEWEKAARGEDKRMYPWGEKPDPKRGNFRGKSDGFRYLAPVGSFPNNKSPYGVMDLAGNAWEWTESWYQPYPGNTTKNEFFGEKFKVIKGGSWFSNLDLARSTLRGKMLPDQQFNYVGFRCAQSIDVKAPKSN